MGEIVIDYHLYALGPSTDMIPLDDRSAGVWKHQ